MAIDNYFRISAVQSELNGAWLTAWHKIGPPDAFQYVGYSRLVGRADYGQSKRGIATIRWLWDELEDWEYAILFTVVQDAIAGGTIYLTSDLVGDEYVPGSWADVSGVPQLIQGQALNGSVGGKFTNVVVSARDVAIDVAPDVWTP